MNRRAFFRALAGAPVAAVTVPAAEADKQLLTVSVSVDTDEIKRHIDSRVAEALRWEEINRDRGLRLSIRRSAHLA